MTQPIDPKELIARLDVSELCSKAEDYYRQIQDPTYLMKRPFESFFEGPETLYKFGLLIAGLKLAKSMTVVDFGAGCCHFSRILNQFECRTISVDPSVTALNIGKRLFEEFPIVGQYLTPPRFLEFDGHHIPVEDDSIDRIMCIAAFHHVPNQEEILAEFFRILKNGGIVGFHEPGRHHSQTALSQYEMQNFGVLENDIAIEEIWAACRKIGYSSIYLKPTINHDLELSYEDYLKIVVQGKTPAGLSRSIEDSMTNSTLFFLVKGQYLPDSRGHIGLRHHILAPRTRFETPANEPLNVDLQIKNTGSAKWITSNIKDIGVVKVGAHLHDDAGHLVDHDFHRSLFDTDTLPGDVVSSRLSLTFPAPGKYRLTIDLVAEGVTWFEFCGSTPVVCEVEVT